MSHSWDSTPRWEHWLTNHKFKVTNPFPYRFSLWRLHLCSDTFLPFPVHCHRLHLRKMTALGLYFASVSDRLPFYVHKFHSIILGGMLSCTHVFKRHSGVWLSAPFKRIAPSWKKKNRVRTFFKVQKHCTINIWNFCKQKLRLKTDSRFWKYWQYCTISWSAMMGK